MHQIKIPRKLIEVALPLDDINKAAAREKSIRHGHPSTLHLWWARRPLATARAVLFSQMVNDPGYERELGRGVNKKEAEKKREELFQIIRNLVRWENTNDERVLKQAREKILESWEETCSINRNHPQADELFNPEKLPAFHDPFAGGGAIPLEAQRLGLEAYASDLNPVAVMINKAMIEIPPKFAELDPVGPPVPEGKPKSHRGGWSGAAGLAEDVRRYGYWMREEALKRIGHLYPKIMITEKMAQERKDLKAYVGQELTVIAWLWARTVKSPNPAFSHVDVPLVKSFVLSSKKGREAWVETVIDGDNYNFKAHLGKQPESAITGTVKRSGGVCIMSKAAMPFKYIREEAKSGRIGQKMMAIVAEGDKSRIYLSPSMEMEAIAREAQPVGVPDSHLPEKALGFRIQQYGMLKHRDLFTSRQLVALTTFSNLVQEARVHAISDAKAAGMEDSKTGIDSNGTGATAYGDALAVYLAIGVDRLADRCSTICGWDNGYTKIRNTFGRQAIPMTWDYCEGNVFSDSTGNFISLLQWVCKFLNKAPANLHSAIFQQDAATQLISINKIISTDPPYYDNIAYADLSDFFYIWMRRSLHNIYPSLFATIVSPKAEELVATPYRHGGKEKAESFFMDGMTKAIQNLAEQAHPAFPVSIYYAFKQSETKEGSTSNTGWEKFLEAVLKAGFAIVGTWPMRTEMSNRMRGLASNALASSIVLVCRKRSIQDESLSRREFQRELRSQMPEALETMVGGQIGQSPVAPVDLAQAAIGPGMAIFSKYEAILNQDGSRMSVHEALILINRAIEEHLNPESGNFDSETLFCSAWFEQYRWESGAYGEADTLVRAKGTAVDAIQATGVVKSGGGKVRLVKWEKYSDDWEPEQDENISIWQTCHHLIRLLKEKGETDAGLLLLKFFSQSEQIRQLAYHMYNVCEKKKWAEDARAYNELIGSWSQIIESSNEADKAKQAEQMKF